MNRKVFQTFTWLMWLALPVTAFRFWLVWDRLPLRMATHFNVNGQPNGWMPRAMPPFTLPWALPHVMVAVFTVILLRRPQDPRSRCLSLGRFWVSSTW